MRASVEAALRRAEGLRARHQPVSAYATLRQAGTDLPREAPEAVLLLEAAFEICLASFDETAPETEATARALLERGEHPAAQTTLGVIASLKAREAAGRGAWENAFALADEAAGCLRTACARAPHDPEPWGALGGVLSRKSEWSQGEPSEALEAEAIDAYERGWRCGPAAYPALNYLELRAIRDCRRETGGDEPTRADYLLDPRLARSDEERARLVQTLAVRRRQARRDEDLPWSAFDVARGTHYLEANPTRFLDDLEYAIEASFREAAGPADRWKLLSAQRSLRRLSEARVPIEGLEEALVKLGRATDPERWRPGGEPPMHEAFLDRERAELRRDVQRLLEQSPDPAERAILTELFERLGAQWSVEEEARFQAELEAERRAFEPPQKRMLRILRRAGAKAPLSELAEFAAGPNPVNLVKLLAALVPKS